MRIGAFQVDEPLPELKEPHAFAVVRPWTDVGDVGTLTLARLESLFGARELARLARPGAFLDFTRYRPTIYVRDNRREVAIPNTTVSYAQPGKANDFLFLRLLEPHMLAEAYVDSVLKLLARFNVKRYFTIGSMYDTVPYTRPFPITGSGSDAQLQNAAELANIRPSSYVGPTSMVTLITRRGASELGIQTMSMIVHLPNYLTLENDYRGQARIMEALGSLYGFPADKEDMDKAQEQARSISQTAEQVMQQEPMYRAILSQLEKDYDATMGTSQQRTRLSPELEKLLQDMNVRFGEGNP